MSSLPPNTNIWIAASEGNQSLVDEFFQSDSTLTPTSKDPNTYTPLHAAASYAHHDLLRWLLKHERASPNDVNITDADGDTPLFVVEDVETARILIEEFEADAKHKNQEGLTAAQNAYENGFEDVAQYVRGVTGEPAPTLEEEDDDDDEQDREHQGQAAAGVHDTDDLKHDGETTKRYVHLLQEYTSCEVRPEQSRRDLYCAPPDSITHHLFCSSFSGLRRLDQTQAPNRRTPTQHQPCLPQPYDLNTNEALRPSLSDLHGRFHRHFCTSQTTHALCRFRPLAIHPRHSSSLECPQCSLGRTHDCSCAVQGRKGSHHRWQV